MFEKIKELERKDLNKMPIADLREMGRCVGVKSPTLAGKEELIEDILSIVLCRDDLLDKLDGRPTDCGVDYSSTPEYDTASYTGGAFASQSLYKTETSGEFYNGIITKEDSKFFVLDYKMNFSNKKLVEAESVGSLQLGAPVIYAKKEDGAVVLDVMEKNATKDQIENIDTLKVCYPNDKFKTINEIDRLTPIAKGSRTICFDDAPTNESLLYKAVRSIKARMNSPLLVAICASIQEEEDKLIDEVAEIQISLTEKESSKSIEYKMSLINSVVKRFFESGEDVLVYFPKDGTTKWNKESLDSLMEGLVNLMKMAGRYKNDRSITTIFNSSSENMFNFLSEFATNIIMTSEDEDVRINLELSETMFKETFLTIREIEQIENAKKRWHKLTQKEKLNLILN